jgi:hypothetical protein
MTDFYIHGRNGVSDEGEPFVELTTPVALPENFTREALAEIDLEGLDPDVTLYRLVEIGPLTDGLPS